MRTSDGIRALIALCFALLAAGEAAAITCPGGSTPIDETLTTGGRWEMCWEERAEEGIVFRDVHFTPLAGTRRIVLKEASVAQIHVVYDDDSARRLLVTEEGLGGSALVDLGAGECPAGTRLSNGSIDVLCQTEADRGYVWKYYGSRKLGTWLELFSIAHTGDLSWIVRWRFHDDGSIQPSMGSSGELVAFGSDPDFGQPLASTGQIAVGWVASIYWRMDFDVGASASDDLVERFEVTTVGGLKTLSKAVLATEGGESLDPLLKRSWRVRDASTLNADGHPISYHFEPLQAGHHYVPHASEGWADHDFAVTAHDVCERFAAGNPTTGGCAADLAGFADGEDVDGADVVLWIRTTAHHLPRDEDVPYRGTRWQGFLVVPRDWTATNPLSLWHGLDEGDALAARASQSGDAS